MGRNGGISQWWCGWCPEDWVTVLLYVLTIELVISAPIGDSDMSLAIGVSIRVMPLVPLAPHSARSAEALTHQLLVTLASV